LLNGRTHVQKVFYSERATFFTIELSQMFWIERDRERERERERERRRKTERDGERESKAKGQSGNAMERKSTSSVASMSLCLVMLSLSLSLFWLTFLCSFQSPLNGLNLLYKTRFPKRLTHMFRACIFLPIEEQWREEWQWYWQLDCRRRRRRTFIPCKAKKRRQRKVLDIRATFRT
jgi:hypothetical protein